MKNSETIFDAWQGTINNMTESWRNATEKWNENQQNNLGNINSATTSWINNSRSFMEQLWQPVIKQIQYNPVNPAYLWNIFNPGIYRPFMNQLSNWYTEMIRNGQRNFTPFVSPDTITNLPHGQASFKLIAHSNRYFNKVAELQFLLLNTAFSAWEKVVKISNERAQNGSSFTNYDDFYNEWSTINEQEYANLFHSKEFVALQEDLIRIQSELMKQYGKQMEQTVNQPVQEDGKPPNGSEGAAKPNQDEQRQRPNKREREFA